MDSSSTCDAADACCLDAGTPLRSVQITGVPDACVTRPARAAMSVTVGGAPRAAKPLRGRSGGAYTLNLRVTGAVSAGTPVCIDLSKVQGCGSKAELCNGGDCSFRLTTQPAAKVVNGRKKRVSCCVDAAARTAGAPTTGGGTGAFSITLVNVGTSTVLDGFFQAAKAKWESVITKDLPDATSTTIDWSRGVFAGFSYKQPVDDVVIFYQVADIDGKGKILGQAGPLRTRADGTELTISGMMQFDAADAGTNPDPNFWGGVILHEMGHVLGIGSIWEDRGCMSGCAAGSGSPNFYLCKAARREYAATPGCKGDLPIETIMGAGSGCAHFSEAGLGIELMTPRASYSGMPMSRITLGAIEDLYGPGSVDYSKADNYTCPGSAIQAAAAARARASEPEDHIMLRTKPESTPLEGVPARAAARSSVDRAFTAAAGVTPAAAEAAAVAAASSAPVAAAAAAPADAAPAAAGAAVPAASAAAP
jgi:hypothetical protein